ncbi:hypothetical protein J4444_00310 [Candidatus Woesearchaeota archaeon]|nr:hypothetical protein [Candidatus Woesearchaeota archaeon]
MTNRYEREKIGPANSDRNSRTELHPEAMLQLELHRYGMVFKNTEFYVRKEEYSQWYSETLTSLINRDLRYENRLDCYLEILRELKGK